MVGLLDIAPAAVRIPVAGAEVEVTGVSARGIAIIMTRFPEIKSMFSGDKVEFTAERIMEIAPLAIAAIIAAGTGSPGDSRAEQIADRLPAQDQVDLLDAILRATTPRGFGPFVKTLLSLGSSIGLDASLLSDAEGQAQT